MAFPSVSAITKKTFKGAMALVTYHLPPDEKSKRVRFVYTMKGRAGEQGIVRMYGGEFLAPACFLVPWKNAGSIREVFEAWGIGFTMMKITVEEVINVLIKKKK